MKKHIPNLLTSLNLLTGAYGCIQVLEGNYQYAIYFVIISGFFDFLDGFVARLLHVQSAIGKELDSLADVISFGMLPALYMVMTLRSVATDSDSLLPYLGLIVVAFSAIRLAKFNIDDRQSDQFIGVPTPANAIMLTSLSFLPTAFAPGLYAYLAITVVSSLLLVAEIPLIALKFKGAGWANNSWKYIFILVTVVLLVGLQLSALPFIIPVYLVISILSNIWPSSS